MFRLFSTLLATVLVVGLTTAADDKKDEKKDAKPTGVWVKEIDNGGELKIDFSAKDAVTITVGVGDNALIIKAKTTIEKDGKIKAKATKIEVKGDFPVKVEDDYECSFKLVVDGKKAKLTDFSANQHDEQGKQVVEGEYTKKEDK